MKASNDTTLYCAGLPLAGERALTDEECAALRGTARRLHRRGWRLTLIPVLGLLPGMAMVTLLTETRWKGLFGVVALAFGMCMAIAILCARDSFRIARAMRDGLRSGRVRRFGAPEQTPEASHGSLDDEEEEEEPLVSLDVLAAGGLVWRWNARAPLGWTCLETTSVPNPPDYAATAAEWAQPWTDPEGETTWWNQRDLSEGELAELRKHARRTVWPYVWLLLLTAYIGAGLFTGEWRDYPWTYWPLLLFFILMDWKAIRMLPNVRRVRRDARLGKVAIFRSKAQTDRPPAPDVAAPLGPATEFLPFSRLPWTHDGQPAPWRKTARR